MSKRLKIEQLLNPEKMGKIFSTKQKQLNKNLRGVKLLTSSVIKYYDGPDFQHAVIHYDLIGKINGQRTELDIYTSAHSSGSRWHTFQLMKHLWENAFSDGECIVPKPLFYLPRLEAMFYKEVRGENLLGYFAAKKKPPLKLLEIIGRNVAAFHQLSLPSEPTLSRCLFNKQTLDPTKILRRHQDKRFVIWRDKLIAFRKKYLVKHRLVFSHGDLHPENIIVINDNKFAFIDFTETCLANPAFDLGSFLQELTYRGRAYYGAKEIHQMRQSFLQGYFQSREKKTIKELQQHLPWYQAWIALRRAILLTKLGDHKNVEFLLNDIKLHYQTLNRRKNG